MLYTNSLHVDFAISHLYLHLYIPRYRLCSFLWPYFDSLMNNNQFVATLFHFYFRLAVFFSLLLFLLYFELFLCSSSYEPCVTLMSCAMPPHSLPHRFAAGNLEWEYVVCTATQQPGSTRKCYITILSANAASKEQSKIIKYTQNI